MRKFVITNPNKFEGYVELTYNSSETLSCIDLRNCMMDEQLIIHFKSIAPTTISKMLAGRAFGPDTQIVEDGFEVSFEMFWKDYPFHRNRFKVEKIWAKMPKADQVAAFYSLHAYKKYLSKEDWQKPMIADRYLRDKEYQTQWLKLIKK